MKPQCMSDAEVIAQIGLLTRVYERAMYKWCLDNLTKEQLWHFKKLFPRGGKK